MRTLEELQELNPFTRDVVNKACKNLIGKDYGTFGGAYYDLVEHLRTEYENFINNLTFEEFECLKEDVNLVFLFNKEEMANYVEYADSYESCWEEDRTVDNAMLLPITGFNGIIDYVNFVATRKGEGGRYFIKDAFFC